jgi:hypothetical protein
MAEMLDSRIAYSLRSEIRKKVFLRKLHYPQLQVVFFRKRFGVTAVSIFSEKRASHFAPLDERIGLVLRVAKPATDEIRHDRLLAASFVARITGSFLGGRRRGGSSNGRNEFCCNRSRIRH